jgi:AraC family cel operon transcriptional repressor
MGEDAMTKLRFDATYPGAEPVRFDYHDSDAIDFAHEHDFYEISVVTGGCVLHEVNGHVDTLTAGDALFIRPGDCHRFDFAEGERYEFFNLPFTPQLFHSAITYLDAAEQAEALCAGRELPEARLSEAEVQQLLREIRLYGDIAAKPKLLYMLLIRLLVTCFLTGPSGEPTGAPEWLGRAAREMRQPANLRQGIGRLYLLAGRSPAYVSRAFRKYLGATPTAYLNRQRLEYARYLLKYTNRSVLDISMECGFDNLSHFYHLFTANARQAPAAYRREFRRNQEAGGAEEPQSDVADERTADFR